jgi:formate dehydrogenase iron-sulfur subunit
MKAILYDARLCINCKQCEAACAEKNHLRYDDAVAAEDRQSEHKFTVVLNKNEKYMRRVCMNCIDPACASVCPVAALRKTAEGPVIYDADRCMGCRYCMIACPFDVPRYEWDKLAPRVRKCDMCSERVAAGQPTACAAICPTGANKFGERDELIAEAQQRLRDNPGKYVNRIYGLHEVGGTSVLLLSSVAFEEFGYPTDGVTEPMPLLTYRALTHVPDLVTLGSVLLGGIWWITRRRTEVQKSEGSYEGIGGLTSGAEAQDQKDGLTAALKHCATPNQTLSETSEGEPQAPLTREP